VEGLVVTDFWRGRRVLVTGHTGFKGAWLTTWLDLLGAEVTGLALPPVTQPSLWALVEQQAGVRQVIGDVRDDEVVGRAFREEPEIVIHMAAQALVREGYRAPAYTFDVNVRGTTSILEAARGCPSVVAVLVVTSDKVYAHDVARQPYGELAPLGGHDPYSASKACCELVATAYRASYFRPLGVGLGTARAGNVIGGGDWSPERLIPDLMRAIAAGAPLSLRCPDATRPWQHVLDPLHGYLRFAERLVVEPGALPDALNFGPPMASVVSVRELAERWGTYFDGAPGWCVDEGPHPAEAPALDLCSDSATASLGWEPALPLDEAVDWTAEWYARHARGESGYDLVCEQIERFEKLAS
jgi:CDP-glucose 4,6-dehydratase